MRHEPSETEALRAALAHERQRSSALERRAALLEEAVRRAYRLAAGDPPRRRTGPSPVGSGPCQGEWGGCSRTG